jgi:hypothetical protein
MQGLRYDGIRRGNLHRGLMIMGGKEHAAEMGMAQDY